MRDPAASRSGERGRASRAAPGGRAEDPAARAAHGEGREPPRLLAANALFYPADAAFAAPASLGAMTGLTDALPGLASPSGHAHEMLFGFALAVIAGNQLGALTGARLGALLALWAIARVAFLWSPFGAVASLADAAFAALLAVQIAPRMLGAAKKLRNLALPAVLVSICAAGIGYHVVARVAPGERAVLFGAVLLFALLLLFMGGRIIAPAAAGQFYRQGGSLEARVQPRIEAALIVATALAAAATLAGAPALGGAAGVAAGLLAGARLWRWRLWALRGRPDIACLAAGYGWLAVGLALLGAALATGRRQTEALHVLAIGALGTLTLNVMAATWLRKARRDPARARLPVWGTLLLAAAAPVRAFAGLGVGDPLALLWIAALLWSAAFALLLALFARVRGERRRSGDAPL
ncbi:MAG: NnrS family protein [Burkholderiales bacterium]|nr:NnrS family protein [Burkholderiales bacterium]